MTDIARSNLKGALFALAAFGLFATHDVGVKALGQSYSPFQIIFFSVLFGFPLATIMLMRDPEPGTLRPVHPWWTALRTAAALLTGVSAFYAFSVLPLAQVYAFIFAAPLLITVLAIPILGEKVGIHRWAAVIVGLVGVLVVLRPGAEPFSLGHLAGLTAALGSATASVVVRKIGKEERSAVLMLYPMMASFVAMAMVLPFVYRPMPAEHLGLAALISALAFAAALLVIAAYRRGDASVVAPMQYSQIVWAAGYGLVFFDELPDRPTILGAGIIILSGLYIVLRETLRGATSSAPVLQTRSRAATLSSPRISVMLRAQANAVPPGHEALANAREGK
ncbi:MAG: DMT family transporter [Paracoccaceae bacterium]|nr:DMT family transporter [Paracoccaceae bacterium]